MALQTQANGVWYAKKRKGDFLGPTYLNVARNQLRHREEKALGTSYCSLSVLRGGL